MIWPPQGEQEAFGMKSRIMKVLDVVVALYSNTDLIRKGNYFSFTDVESLHSDFQTIEDIVADVPVDGTLIILDMPCAPEVHAAGDTVVVRGPFGQLEEAMPDKRYTLLGNQGLLYRFLLYQLEKKYGIYSFHANALYHRERNELFVVFGGAASGKSPALMAGLCNGLEVVGTELVHFRLSEQGYTFYPSSCMDNIRPSCVWEDFPELLDRLDVPDPRGFSSPSSKYLLNMQAFKTKGPIENPRLRLIIPKVEAGRSPVISGRILDEGAKTKALFDNLSEKIGASFTMYNCMACNGFDCLELSRRRLTAAGALLEAAGSPAVETYLASPRYFMEVLQ